ncbi:MAG: hypothetical protein ACRDRW_12375, partial [Pseudonocardiaceae bacterium]
MRNFFKGRVTVDKADVGMDPVKVSLRFEAFPTARKEFRALLQGLLPTSCGSPAGAELRRAVHHPDRAGVQ